MFGAAAVRNKKRKQQSELAKGDLPRGPYIKPFGPRFDPSELPYFKYKRAIQEAKELQQNISRAKKSKSAAGGAVPGVAVRAAGGTVLAGSTAGGRGSARASNGGMLKVHNNRVSGGKIISLEGSKSFFLHVRNDLGTCKIRIHCIICIYVISFSLIDFHIGNLVNGAIRHARRNV